MIIIKISGGLGNQLFQYSFGRFLSLKLNTELKLDIQTNYNYAGFTKRYLGLNHFNINAKIATLEEIRNCKLFENEFLSRIERKSLQKFPFLNRRYVVQNLYSINSYRQEYVDNCYYDGYWQSESFFKPGESVIKKDLEFKLQLNKNIVTSLEKIDSRESVSLHIRRGDYLTRKAHRKLFAKCSIEYYKQAIEFFNSKSNHFHYFVFSDEIEWAKDNFEGSQFSFIDSNLNFPEIDLFLMSRCKNNIIANSSFSWWGAWLNKNSDKIVIAPHQWYNGKLNKIINQLIPSEWNRI